MTDQQPPYGEENRRWARYLQLAFILLLASVVIGLFFIFSFYAAPLLVITIVVVGVSMGFSCGAEPFLLFEKIALKIRKFFSPSSTLVEEVVDNTQPKIPCGADDGFVIAKNHIKVYFDYSDVEFLSVGTNHESDGLMVQKIGFGTYGDVFSVCTHGEEFALKIEKNPNKKETENERNQLKILNHKNIIPLFFNFRKEGRLHLLLPKMDFSLETCIETRNRYPGTPFLNSSIKEALLRIASALIYLQRMKFVHQDLKPGNVLVDMSSDRNSFIKVCLTDFGSVAQVGGPFTGKRSPVFSSPEYLEENHETLSVSYYQDIYAFIVLMVELITLKPAFSITDDSQKAPKDDGKFNLFRLNDPQAEKEKMIKELIKMKKNPLVITKYVRECDLFQSVASLGFNNKNSTAQELYDQINTIEIPDDSPSPL